MRLLVCGGRDFKDRRHVYDVLDRIHSERRVTCLIEGGASGADKLAHDWMCERDVDRWLMFEADWKKHGKAAGPMRNQQMIDEGKPDLIVAFPGGRGTKDMVSRGRKANITVLEIKDTFNAEVVKW